MQPAWTRTAGPAPAAAVPAAGRLTHPAPRPATRPAARPARGRPLPAGGNWVGLDAAARVLALAADPQRPVTDRLRLHAVLGRHLDGVFRTLVAPAVAPGTDPALPPPVPVTSRLLHRIDAERDALVHHGLVPALAGAGVTFVGWDELTRAEAVAVRRLLRRRVHPLLTPMAVDAGHPFPVLACGSLTVVARVQERPGDATRLGCVGVPPSLPRTVRLGGGRVVTAETLVAALLPELFVGTRVVEHSCLRVTRAARRAPGSARAPAPVTRAELDAAAGSDTEAELMRHLGIGPEQLYRVRSSLAMGDALSGLVPDDTDDQ